MTSTIKMALGLAAVGGAIGYARARARQRAAAPSAVDERDTERYHVQPGATGPGIAAVDPEPMTQIAGEGIDPDMDTSLPDNTIPEELRVILSPGFAHRSRHP